MFIFRTLEFVECGAEYRKQSAEDRKMLGSCGSYFVARDSIRASVAIGRDSIFNFLLTIGNLLGLLALRLAVLR